MVRTKAYRRHKEHSKMWRRLKEDRNEHYNDLNCPCYTNKKAMARFKEQPKQDCHCCKNERHKYGAYQPTMQELRHDVGRRGIDTSE
jgi:hypothetical protein